MTKPLIPKAIFDEIFEQAKALRPIPTPSLLNSIGIDHAKKKSNLVIISSRGVGKTQVALTLQEIFNKGKKKKVEKEKIIFT